MATSKVNIAETGINADNTVKYTNSVINVDGTGSCTSITVNADITEISRSEENGKARITLTITDVNENKYVKKITLQPEEVGF